MGNAVLQQLLPGLQMKLYNELYNLPLDELYVKFKDTCGDVGVKTKHEAVMMIIEKENGNEDHDCNHS